MPQSTSSNETLCDFLVLRRIEGATIAAAATLLFGQLGGNWWLFAALILLPDIAMLGYFAGPRIGALSYNAFHTYAVPLFLGCAAAALGLWDVVAMTAIWVAHIGFDRALGYGLKCSSGFDDTHLSTPQFAER